MRTFITSSLAGRKTYCIIAVALIYAVTGWYGHYLTPKEAVDIILAALGAGAFRSALAEFADQLKSATK